ncbi:hypothetical protein [Enterococcus faecium]|uniref:hypothetical protein n=1 Tax=Enterococcus faecium TaxID=1352 RepID=UPI00032D8F79|nr:hypothetical protein [Enterococcus faecium]EME7093664.1 hypothetical protein [Enterococcus faecium]EME7094374.1 hypothetical protein [Enterococcus faecium]EOL03043.1 hypothetical protein SIW_02773 [Enterococcus faecium EnGen0158]EOL04546.1 hypothetical protein SIY_02755 [Enterococcus faecium EnGen0159]MDV7732363.1 hypothetical protein [Enterococcus faecium]
MKPSDRWKQINEEYGGERIRDHYKTQGVITNSRELSLVIPAEWAAEESREKLLEVIHNFYYLWEREGLSEVPKAVPADNYGKRTVAIFLPASEIDQLKADFKTIKQSFARKNVVLSHLLQRLDVNAPVLPPKMELGTTNLYPPELVEFAKRLAEIPLEEQELYSAEFEDFKAKCKEIYVSPHTLLQKCRQGKL